MSRAATDWGPDEIQIPTTGVVKVGRVARDGIALGHPTVAEPHALLSRTVGGLQVRDRSHGRTQVNGRTVREVASLRHGDRVAFGAVTFQVDEDRLRRETRLSGLRIVAEGLGVLRGLEPVLAGVSLQIKAGEFVGLLGPSGAGKSTLLKCLAGFLPPAEGSRLRADTLELPAQLAGYRPLIGYVPQEDVIFPGLTVAQNLDFALRLRNPDLGRGERREMIDAVLRQLDVAGLAGRPAGEISPGQRKRACVAQELMTRPRALFLDEPTSGLDPAQEMKLMTILHKLAGQGMTIVCATHVLENLLLFDKVVAVVKGRVAYDGPPDRLLDHYGASNYSDLYVKLEAKQPGQKPDVARPARSRPIVPPSTVAPPEPIGLRREVAVQVARGVALILRDRTLRVLLVLQPLMIGALIGLSQVSNTEAYPLLTFAAVTSVWLGLNNTARELVRDRRAYLRERVLGVTPLGHLASKFVLFAGVGLGQVVLLYLMLLLGSKLDPTLAAHFRSLSAALLIPTLWATYLGGLLLGLLVSTLANTQEVAVAFLPLIVLPQLLLTGAATQMTTKGRFHSVAHLVRPEGRPERSLPEWVVEGLSIPLYTRPSVAILREPPKLDDIEPSAMLSEGLVRSIDAGHLAILLAITALAVVLAFRIREREWMSAV